MQGRLRSNRRKVSALSLSTTSCSSRPSQPPMCSSPMDCCSLRCCRPLPAAGGALTCPGGELPSPICDAAQRVAEHPPAGASESHLSCGKPSSSCRLGFLTLSSDSEDGSHSSLESEMGRGSSWTRPCPQVPPLLTMSVLTPRLHSDSTFLAWFLQRLWWGLAALSLVIFLPFSSLPSQDQQPTSHLHWPLPPGLCSPGFLSCRRRPCPLPSRARARTTVLPL